MMVNNTLPDIEKDEEDQYNFADLEEKIRKANSLYEEENSAVQPKQNPLKEGLSVGLKQVTRIVNTGTISGLGSRYTPQEATSKSEISPPISSFDSKQIKQLLDPLNSIKSSALVLVNLLTKISSNQKTKVSNQTPVAEKLTTAANDNNFQTKKPLYESASNDDQSNPIRKYAQEVQSIVNQSVPESKPKERKETLPTGQDVIRDTKTGRFVKKPVETPQQLKPASSGESSTSAYTQNERKIEEKSKSVEIEKISDDALKQLSNIFNEAIQNLPDNSGGGLVGSALSSVMGMGGLGKGLGNVGKAISGMAAGGTKTTGNILSKTSGSIQKAASSSNGILKGASGALKGAGNIFKGAGKYLPGITKGIGVAAVPIAAGFEAKHRIDEGQTTKQVIAGTGASTVGGLAGAVAGAKGGALVGAGIGSLFGGAGAAPGAVIGGGIGAIAGGIGGSKLGGAVADHFTGVGKVQPKEIGPTPKTKDLTSLQKRQAEIQKKQSHPVPAPSSVDARSQTTVVNQKNTSMVAAGPSGGGSRGSLDLKKFGQH